MRAFARHAEGLLGQNIQGAERGASRVRWRERALEALIAPARQLLRPTTRHGPAPRPTLAPDAVADVGGLWCVDHPHNLQRDALWEHLNEATATAIEHGDQVDLYLVEHSRRERSLRCDGSMH